MLDNDEVVVQFIKNDGSNRVMRATRSPDLIGPNKFVPYVEGEDVCHVYDLDLNEPRAFRYDRLRLVNGIPFSEKQDVHSKRFVEDIAILIYDEAMRYMRDNTTPRWVPNGNAITQDIARDIALKIINKVEKVLKS